MQRSIILKKFFTFLFVACAAVAIFHAKTVFAAMAIPTTASGGGVGSAITSVGSKIGGYGSDAMYVLYGVAGLSVPILIAEYFLMREHKKTIYSTLGIGIAAGAGGLLAGAVSHGETSSSGTGALIITAAGHLFTYASAHLHNLHGAVAKK